MCSFFFFSSRRRHTRSLCDWSSDVCSSDLCAQSDRWRKITSSIALSASAWSHRAAKSTKCLKRWSTTSKSPTIRSEERRVGKEYRTQRSPEHGKQKIRLQHDQHRRVTAKYR